MHGINAPRSISSRAIRDACGAFFTFSTTTSGTISRNAFPMDGTCLEETLQVIMSSVDIHNSNTYILHSYCQHQMEFMIVEVVMEVLVV